MSLSGQPIKIGDQGSDVKLLHAYLQQLGHGKEISPEEINYSFYQEGTAQAVASFQQQHGLQPTGEVDEATAEAINNAVKEPWPEPEKEPWPDPVPNSFIVRGHVRQSDNNPLAGLIVRAFDRAPKNATAPLGLETTTDDEGYYEIQYTEQDFQADDRDGVGPNIFIRVYKGAALLSESRVTENAGTDEIIDLTVAPVDTGQAQEEFKVSGKVFNKQQEPLAGKAVQVFDVDLRGVATAATLENLQEIKASDGLEFLGQAETDLKGYYEVAFTSERYQRAELGRADVIAYVVEDELIAGRSQLIVWKDNGQAEIKDLDIILTDSAQRGNSEYEQLMISLRPLLEGSRLQLHELSEPQAAFLAEETEKKVELITLLIEADKLRAGLPDKPFSTDLFYGLGRQEIPPAWAAVITTSEDELRNAVKQSVEQNLIPAQPDAVIEDFIKAIRRYSTTEWLKESSVPEISDLNESLKLALPDESLQIAFLEAASAFRHTDPQKFWQEHLPAAGFDAAQIENLQLVNQLYVLTGGYMPVVEQLKQRNINNPRQMLEVSVEQWRDILNVTGVPDDMPGEHDEEKKSRFIEAVQGQLNAAFPTQKIALMIGRDELGIAGEHVKKHVQSFFETNADFDFATSRVQDFADAIREVAGDKHEEVKSSLMALQRTYQVSPSPEVMAKLIENNLTSAYQIADIPEQIFIQHYGDLLGGEKAAWLVHRRSQHQVQRVQDVAVTLNEMVKGVAPGATTYHSERFNLQATLGRHIPNWEELLGSPDFCECRECRSVISPAAYFVELMQFLKKSRVAASNILDEVLLGRRPDLAHLQLSCENTNTIIPYVDLVNEILEYYVAHDRLDANAAYNIESETAAELRANPQHTHLEAYRKLKEQVYPFELPYHQPLDVIRTYLSQIGASRYELIKHLGRETAPPSIMNALVSEYLGLSPKEFAILTGNNFDGTTNRQAEHEYFGYSNQRDFETNRHRVTELLERAGIKYAELVALVKTRFLNPDQGTLDYLQDIFKSANLAPAQLYERFQQIINGTLDVKTDAELSSALVRNRISATAFREWLHNNFERFKEVVTLYEPGSACDVANTSLRSVRSIYENLSSSGVADRFFSKLHRFIRLWKMSGWSIEDLDTLLSSLQADEITPQLLSHIADAKKLQEQTRLSVPQIAVLWGTMDIYGPQSLYARLFLNKALRQMSVAFGPDELGTYFSDEEQKISRHALALLAAFRISSAELDAVLRDLRINPAVEPLSLQAISRMYRYTVLAKTLKMRVTDLITLKEIFPVNPFSRWSGTEFVNVSPRDTLAFVETARKVKDSGFEPGLLKYIFTGEASEKNIKLDYEKLLQAVRTIREGLLKIETDYPEADQTPITEEFLRPKMQLFFQPEVVEQFFGMINDNLLYSTQTEANLSLVIPGGLAARASYRKATGRLEFKGVMTERVRAELLALSDNANFQSAVNRLFEQPEKFLRENFYGIFPGTERDSAFNRLLGRAGTLSDAAQKSEFFYQSYLPYLKKVLKHNALLQELSALLGLSLPQTEALVGQRVEPLLTEVVPQGLTGTYFNTTDTGGPSVERLDQTVDFAWTAHPISSITGAAYSIRWEGYICPNETAEYTFIVDVAQADESFKLLLDGARLEKTEGDTGLSWEMARSLKAGRMYPIKLEYMQRTGNAGIKLSWQTDKLPKTPVAALYLYPSRQLGAIREAAQSYHRASHVIKKFDFTSGEISHFITHAARFNNLDFTALTPKTWLRLFDYVSLRKQTGVQGELLIALFLLAERVSWSDLKLMLSEAFGWGVADLEVLKEHFRLSVRDFQNEEKLITLSQAFALIKLFGLSAQQLIEWASVTTNFDELDGIAHSVKQAVKAQYEAEEWLDVGARLSDRLREQQKRVLISAILVDENLRRWGVRDADGLFEYFLIDVQMDACMETSRIKQAISSVQLLVTRCLLNLERDVSPSNVDAARWSWMKNYRVWEAARKIFLFPENWLEPEWRDDRSPFFKELESELQQTDLTALSVENAFRNYLFKLNEVAHLNVYGVYEDSDTKVLHVFARTYHAPYQYFYRTRDEFGHWAAWENVQLDIRGYEDAQAGGENSGVHLIPIVWKKRLFLFWTELMEKTRENRAAQTTTYNNMGRQTPSAMEHPRYWEVRLAWSEYRDRKWTPKRLSNRFAEMHDLSRPSSHIVTVVTNPATQELRLHVSGGAFTLSDVQSDISVEVSHQESTDNFYMGVRRRNRALRFQTNDYLSAARDYKLIFPDTAPPGAVSSRPAYPFFYSDRERVYYASPVTPQNPASQIKSKVLIPFVPYAKYQSSGSTKNATNFIAGSSVPSLAVGAGLALGNDLMSPPSLENSALLASGGTEMLSTVAKMGGPLMGSSQTVGSAFGGNPTPTINPGVIPAIQQSSTGLIFKNFFHPYSNDYLTQLNQKGVAGLLQVDTERAYDRGDSLFRNTYVPNLTSGFVRTPLPKIDIDFDEFGTYSQYNYELFFHAPLYIATRLSRNGKYAEAMQWFHYIFDPTTNEPPDSTNPNARYWKVLPFRSAPVESLEEYLRKLQVGTEAEKDAVTKKIEEWRKNPFNPHLVARGRPLAYMKNVVIKYIENLLAWGDDLFRRDTIESINEATQIYIIAAHVLGQRPEFIPKRGESRIETYATIQSRLDAFSNALVQMENIFPFSSDFNVAGSASNPVSLLGIGRALYFCIPNNEKLLQYWETVADRLFKIRHCMNIEGVERQLALFEPPIDPALLAQAAAAGVSIGNILGDLNATSPTYRFNFLLQKALETVAEVKSLGSALLSAIEKRDNEAITRLRAGHERQLLQLSTQVKERQLLESKAARQSLEKSRETAQMRLDHYVGLLGEQKPVPPPPQMPAELNAEAVLPADTIIPPSTTDVDVSLMEGGERGVKLIPKETQDLLLSESAKSDTFNASLVEILAGFLGLIPQFNAHAQPVGVGASTGFGGRELSWFVGSGAKVLHAMSASKSMAAAAASKMASFVRRDQEWVMQANMAAREIVQLDKQLIAAQIREQMAGKELQNLRQQIRNAQEVEQFLQEKFSREETYQWMKEQLALCYKQSYQMAYDLAKQAEKAYRFELGRTSTNFIQYGYWNSTFEGLTAGEKLHLALKQMERSYLEENRREYELTKHVSLAMLNPEALLRLKQNGRCEFTLPEELFDLDHPGHYFRRVKSVSLSIPCIAGPQTTVSATLRLLRNSVRINTGMNVRNEYPRPHEDGLLLDDERFVEYIVPYKAIATSSAQNDSGVFELNFRDERYLPFEAAGVISTWQLAMPDAARQFDYNTISDVIIHLRYTAREGGDSLRSKAEQDLKERFIERGFLKIFSLKHDFPQAFHQLTHPSPGAARRPVEISITEQHLPYFLAQTELGFKELRVYLQAREPNGRVAQSGYGILVNGIDVNTMNARTREPLRPPRRWDNFGRNMIVVSVETDSEDAQWRLKRAHTIEINPGSLPGNVEDILLMFVV